MKPEIGRRGTGSSYNLAAAATLTGERQLTRTQIGFAIGIFWLLLASFW
jgi:hypothetical protein